MAVGAPAGAATAADLTESFDSWTPAGWTTQNNSSPIGTMPAGWFGANQIEPSLVFGSYNGDPKAYAAANFNSTSGSGTISAWLITPQLTELTQGDTISFYTRKMAGQDYPDRLELRMSTGGACSPGSGPTTVGTFTELLLTINPGLTTGVYPTGWTRYEATLPPMAPATGCFAFRYHVTNGGPGGSNSDYIGIDQVEIRDRADNVEPETALLSGLDGATTETGGTFTYAGVPTAGIAGYQCRLQRDGDPAASFAGCPSAGQSYADLADGSYVFEVRAVTHGGNVDPMPANRPFTVDTTPPATEIVDGPTGTVATGAASFSFTAEPATDVESVECRLRTSDDDDPPFAPCSSLDGHGYEGLADGTYTFEVRARDALDNVESTPATRTFTVDTTPPSVTIDAGPDAETTATTVSFAYAATPAEDVDVVECRLVGPADADPAFAECPVDGTSYAELAVGEYRFELRARDAAGNASETATRTFRVVAPPPTDDGTNPGDGTTPGDGTPPSDEATKPPPPRPIPFVRPTPEPVTMPPSAFPEVRGLRLERNAFRAASSGPSFGRAESARVAGGRGTWLVFGVDRAVAVELRISRAVQRRWRPLRGVIRRSAPSGANRVPFHGRFRGITLRPGRYRLSVTAVDRASGTKTTTLRTFRIRG